jgi:peptidyl-prolyl cis-trans isomerase C
VKYFVSVLLVLSVSSLACKKSSPAPAPAVVTAPAAPPASTPPPPAGEAAVPAAPVGSATAPPPAAVKPVPAVLPDVLAKVNGEPVERWELEAGLKSLEGRAGSAIPPERRDEIVRNLLNQLVEFHVLAQESRARKIEVSEQEVQAKITEIKSSFPTPAAFEQALKAQGLSVDRLQRQTRTGLLINKLVDTEINPKVAVTDADVDAFYKQNLERFKEGESVHASHILIAVQPGADATAKQQGRIMAEALLKQIRGGADFAKLATEQSQDPGSAPKGGDLGFFPKGQMDPKFEAAAFALKPGSVSDVVESSFGFHIIKVHERRAPRTAPFKEVSAQIKEFLTGRERETKLTQFVDAAKTKHKVELLV